MDPFIFYIEEKTKTENNSSKKEFEAIMPKTLKCNKNSFNIFI
jgi:hypothetical protein